MLNIKIFPTCLEVSGNPSGISKLLQALESDLKYKYAGIVCHMFNAKNPDRQVSVLQFEGNGAVLYYILNYIKYYTDDYDIR